MGNKFFEWIAECCKELGWPIEQGRLLIDDISWYACFDDGMTPKEAVKECLSKLTEEDDHDEETTSLGRAET